MIATASISINTNNSSFLGEKYLGIGNWAVWTPVTATLCPFCRWGFYHLTLFVILCFPLRVQFPIIRALSTSLMPSVYRYIHIEDVVACSTFYLLLLWLIGRGDIILAGCCCWVPFWVHQWWFVQMHGLRVPTKWSIDSTRPDANTRLCDIHRTQPIGQLHHWCNGNLCIPITAYWRISMNLASLIKFMIPKSSKIWELDFAIISWGVCWVTKQ